MWSSFSVQLDANVALMSYFNRLSYSWELNMHSKVQKRGEKPQSRSTIEIVSKANVRMMSEQRLMTLNHWMLKIPLSTKKSSSSRKEIVWWYNKPWWRAWKKTKIGFITIYLEHIVDPKVRCALWLLMGGALKTLFPRKWWTSFNWRWYPIPLHMRWPGLRREKSYRSRRSA